MAYNLFIAYDLMSPGQNYDAVRGRIRELGPHWQFQYSLFWVNTELTPNQAFAHVSQSMDANDRLAVINAESGVVTSWDRPPVDEINSIWFEP
jgi:asparagine N-glycosylation enzyme membrane subunit Stt3